MALGDRCSTDIGATSIPTYVLTFLNLGGKYMSLQFLPLLAYDEVFANTPDAHAVSSADKVAISENQARELMRSMFQDGSHDLNFVATCDCGELTGNFYVGSTCKKCKSVVRNNFANELKFRMWLEIPEDIMPPVLHPAVYRVLEKWLSTYQNESLLKILLDVDAELPPALQGVLGQGYTYFYKNFDDIIMYLIKNYPPLQTPTGKKRSLWITEFLNKYYKILFTRHLPILNQSLHLITQTGSMKYSDESSVHVLKARIELANAIYSYHNSPTHPFYIDQRLLAMASAYNDYVNSIMKQKMIAKEGHIRKSNMGSRMHCSFRGVIVPINERHRSNELHLPWRIGVAGLKLELINLMIKRFGYTIHNALAKHNRALSNYDPDIDKMMKILIKECRYKGLPVLLGRNPNV